MTLTREPSPLAQQGYQCKRCKKCNEVKELSGYYKHMTNADRKQSSCKTCYGVMCRSFKARTGYDRAWYRLQKMKDPQYNVKKWTRQK